MLNFFYPSRTVAAATVLVRDSDGTGHGLAVWRP
jgi:hypothetical protein